MLKVLDSNGGTESLFDDSLVCLKPHCFLFAMFFLLPKLFQGCLKVFFLNHWSKNCIYVHMFIQRSQNICSGSAMAGAVSGFELNISLVQQITQMDGPFWFSLA